MIPRADERAVLFRRFRHRHPDRFSLRDQRATGRKQPLSGIDDRRDVILEQRKDAMDIGDDGVRAFRQADIGGNALDELDPIAAVIRSGNLAGELNDVARLDRKHLSGAEAAGQERENP